MQTDNVGLLVVDAAAREAGRYAIDHVLVEGDGTAVATDGRHLVAIEGRSEESGEGGALVPGKVARAIARNGLGRVNIAKAMKDVGGSLEYESDDGRVHVELPPIDAVFPDWRDMMAGGGDVLGHFSPRLLAQAFGVFAKVVESLDDARCSITLRMGKGDCPRLLADMEIPCGRHVSAVIAALKPTEPNADSSWVRKE